MNIETLREYILQKPAVTEGFPFGEDTLVFKVNNKIFFLAGLESAPLQFNVKCDPEKALDLRDRYNCVLPGYHMNKKHWNTIVADGSASNKLLQEWITDSYNLVVAGLTKIEQKKLAALK